jgi:hypothetical protein
MDKHEQFLLDAFIVKRRSGFTSPRREVITSRAGLTAMKKEGQDEPLWAREIR